MEIIEIATYSGELLEAHSDGKISPLPIVFSLINDEELYCFGNIQKVYIKAKDFKSAVVRTIKEDF